MPVVMDADRIGRHLTRIAHEIVERNKGTDDLALVGVRTRGVPIARRIARTLREITGHDTDRVARHHAVSRRPMRHALVRSHSSGGRRFSSRSTTEDSARRRRAVHGRTTRAALDALIDYGRPKAIQLIVLVDRGHRELPIKADYVGKNLPTAPEESVQVRLIEIDGEDEVVLETGGGA